MNSMKRQNNRILKEELPRSVGAQYADDQWRNSSRKNERISRETGISGNFVGRIKGDKYRFELQFLKWDFS